MAFVVVTITFADCVTDVGTVKSDCVSVNDWLVADHFAGGLRIAFSSEIELGAD